jgi:hypothetical protein
MSVNPRRRLCVAVLAACALLAPAGSAAADSSGPADRTDRTPRPAAVVSAAQAATAAQQAAVLDYWTPRRLRAAVAADGPRPLDPPAAPPAVDSKPFAGPPRAVRHVGRLFMTLPDGRGATCTAAVVKSANRDLLATAAHCVHLPSTGEFMARLLFVPGYRDGAAPYGKFAARSAGIAPAWAERGDHRADFAFVALGADRRGRHVQDVVGGRRAGFTLTPAGDRQTGPRTVLGYPYVPPFDGELLRTCSGRSTPVTDERLLGGEQLKPCRMTGGSSGGPWYGGFAPATGAGVQLAVTSSRPRGAEFKQVAWGAVFDAAARRVFRSQQRL